MTPVDPNILAEMSEAQAVGAISATLLEWRLTSIDNEIKTFKAEKLDARVSWIEKELREREKQIGRLWVAIFAAIGTFLAGLLLYWLTTQHASGSESTPTVMLSWVSNSLNLTQPPVVK